MGVPFAPPSSHGVHRDRTSGSPFFRSPGPAVPSWVIPIPSHSHWWARWLTAQEWLGDPDRLLPGGALPLMPLCSSRSWGCSSTGPGTSRELPADHPCLPEPSSALILLASDTLVHPLNWTSQEAAHAHHVFTPDTCSHHMGSHHNTPSCHTQHTCSGHTLTPPAPGRWPVIVPSCVALAPLRAPSPWGHLPPHLDCPLRSRPARSVPAWC